MRHMFRTFFKGAQCGAMAISLFILIQILINPNHMVLLYEFNLPLLWLEVIVFGAVVSLSLIELGIHVKKEMNQKEIIVFSKLTFLKLVSVGTFFTGLCLYLQKIGVFT